VIYDIGGRRNLGNNSSVDELLAIMMHHYVELIAGLAHSQSFWPLSITIAVESVGSIN